MFIIEKDKNRKTRLKYKTSNQDLDDMLRAEYSTANPAAKFSPYASEEISALSLLGSFKSGLAMDILKFVKKNFPKEKISLGDGVIELIKPKFVVESIKEPNNTQYKLRDYQLKSLKLALSHGRGCAELCTSYGKSLLIHSLIENIWIAEDKKLRTLILVPNILLVKQFYSDLIDYGIGEENVCMFTASKPKLEDKAIIIANRQYLQNHSHKLPEIELCIVDECHTVANKEGFGSKLVTGFDTVHKYAFTGTMPKDKPGLWNIIGTAGTIFDAVKAHELQTEGSVAQTNITSIKINHGVPQPECTESKDALERAKRRFPLEWKYIESCAKSNKFISDICMNLKGNTIVLFDHVEHGQVFKKICANNNKLKKQIFFVDGSVKLDHRDDVRSIFEEDNNCILLAQVRTFGTGVSIKNIKNICFAFPSGISSSKVVQAVGRGLRLRPDKTDMYLYDFYHSFKYSQSHYEERRGMYEDNYKSKTFKEFEYDLRAKRMALLNK